MLFYVCFGIFYVVNYVVFLCSFLPKNVLLTVNTFSKIRFFCVACLWDSVSVDFICILCLLMPCFMVCFVCLLYLCEIHFVLFSMDIVTPFEKRGYYIFVMSHV